MRRGRRQGRRQDRRWRGGREVSGGAATGRAQQAQQLQHLGVRDRRALPAGRDQVQVEQPQIASSTPSRSRAAGSVRVAAGSRAAASGASASPSTSLRRPSTSTVAAALTSAAVPSVVGTR